MGRFGHHCLIPARDAVAAAGHVWVPYGRDQIRKGPRQDPGKPLDRDGEQALLDHYGVGTGEVGPWRRARRSASPARSPRGRPSGRYSPSRPAITICCTSSVPSPMVRILASR